LPLITLNLNDLRGKGTDMQTGLWNILAEYEGWLCTAVKGEDRPSSPRWT